MAKPIASGADESSTVTPRAGGFTVAPSPFNGVKLELGVIVIGAVLLALTHGRMTQSALAQWLLLGGYGLAGMGWLLIRTRRILRRLEPAARSASDGPK